MSALHFARSLARLRWLAKLQSESFTLGWFARAANLVVGLQAANLILKAHAGATDQSLASGRRAKWRRVAPLARVGPPGASQSKFKPPCHILIHGNHFSS